MAEPQQAAPQFALQRIYLKDVSFETPNSPRIFTQKWDPKIHVDLNSHAQALDPATYEVVLSITVTATVEEQTAYLVEVKQAGIFVIRNFPEQELGAMLNAYCPNILFPYGREAVSDLVNRGSFPQMLLAPVNFDALYAQRLAEQQQAAGSA